MAGGGSGREKKRKFLKKIAAAHTHPALLALFDNLDLIYPIRENGRPWAREFKICCSN